MIFVACRQWALAQQPPPPLVSAGWKVRLWVQDLSSMCITYQSKTKRFLVLVDGQVFKMGRGGGSLLFLWAECSSLSSNVKEFDFLFLSFLSPVDNLFNLNLIFGWFGFMLGNFVSTLFCALWIILISWAPVFYIILKAFARRAGVVKKCRGKEKELSPQDAALMIQLTFRAYLIRRSKALRALRDLAVAKTKLKEIRALFNNFSYRSRVAKDAGERQRFSEKIIVLLLTVDSIEVTWTKSLQFP